MGAAQGHSDDVVLPVVTPAGWIDDDHAIIAFALLYFISGSLWIYAFKAAWRAKDVDIAESANPVTLATSLLSSDNGVDEADPVQAGLRVALKYVEEDRKALVREGMSRYGFFFGVINIMLTGMFFVGMPEHFWLYYMFKCLILVPIWYAVITTLYKGHLFVLDFCWYATICFGAYLSLSVCGLVPVEYQKTLFLTFLTGGSGPLAGANLALGNGVTFHATIELVSNFIHLAPPLVSLSMMAYNHRLQEAWPNRFPSRQEVLDTPTSEIFMCGWGLYLVWLALHATWLLSVGINCPQKGFPTIFDWSSNKLGLQRALEKKGYRGARFAAAVYLGAHFVLCMVAFLVATMLAKNLLAHLSYCALVVLTSVWVGAGKYSYLILHKTEKKLKAILAAEAKAPKSFKNGKSRATPFGQEYVDADSEQAEDFDLNERRSGKFPTW